MVAGKRMAMFSISYFCEGRTYIFADKPLLKNMISHLQMTIIMFGIVTLSLFNARSAFAYDETLMNLTLDEIVVIGDSVTESTATTVGLKTIEQGKNITLPDVLKDEPDIDIKQRSGAGDTADTLAIRGFSGNRIMLNINDRPANAAGVIGGYYIDWGTIPLDNIEKIELIRGGSSVRYGNNALGGVINIITKKPTEKPTFTVFGNYSTGEGIDSIGNMRLTHSYKTGVMGYSLTGSFQKADAYLWNNDFEGRNLAATTYIDMPAKGELTLGIQYSNAKKGFIRENRLSSNPYSPDFYVRANDDYPLAFGETFSPYSGNAFIPGPGATWDKTKYYLDLGYTQPIDDGLLEFRIYKNHEDRKEKNYSSSSINYMYADGVLVLDRKVESDRSYGGNIQITMPFNSHEVLAGADYKVLAYGDTIQNYLDTAYNSWWYPVTGYPASQRGINWGYYAQDTWSPSEQIALIIGLRYDRYRNESINGSTLPELKDSALTPKITLIYRMTDADTVTASLYQAMRTPGLSETYWWAEGATLGYPILKPEKNNAVEITYQRKFDQSDYMRLSGYYYSVKDYIMFRFDPNWMGVYNVDNVKQAGISLDGRLTFSSKISGKGSVTWQKNKKGVDIYDTNRLSDELDYHPEWKANAGLEFGLPYESVLNITGRYIGERQTVYSYTSWGWPAVTGFKLIKLDPYFTSDIDLKIPLMKHYELSLYAENIFDKRYEEQFGYPMTGRIIGSSFKISF
jgi:iron complex outermembrane receptor protein